MLNLLGDILLTAFAVAHATAIILKELVILLLLLLILLCIILTTEALIDEVHEDSLGDVAELD